MIMNDAFKTLVILVVLFLPKVCHPQMQSNKSFPESPLILRGRAIVSGLRLSSVSKEDIDVLIELKLEWVNEGKEPAIVVVDSLPTFRHWILTRDSGPLTENNLVYEEFGGENLSEEAEWRRLRFQLDRPTPLKDKVRILAPGEKWAFELSGSMTFPIKFDAKAIPHPPAIWETISSLESLRKIPSLYLRVESQFWPVIIEKPEHHADRPFGHKLQKRWRAYGILQLEPIVSEPMPLKLPDALPSNQLP